MSVVGTSIPTLLNVLCKDGTTKDLDRHPGLTKLFADVLDFVFEFDYIKVSVCSLFFMYVTYSSFLL